MTSKPKLPKNLGIKIGSKLEQFWTQVRDQAKASIENAEYGILLQREVLKIADKKIRAERKSFYK